MQINKKLMDEFFISWYLTEEILSFSSLRGRRTKGREGEVECEREARRAPQAKAYQEATGLRTLKIKHIKEVILEKLSRWNTFFIILVPVKTKNPLSLQLQKHHCMPNLVSLTFFMILPFRRVSYDSELQLAWGKTCTFTCCGIKTLTFIQAYCQHL